MGDSTRRYDTDRLGKDTGAYTYIEKKEDGTTEYRHYKHYDNLGKEIHDPETGKTEEYDRLGRKK